MSLWAEHIGSTEKCFQEPQTMECLNYVNKIAEDNWETYIADENKALTGHLMRYPIQVSKDGKVSALPGCESFPDVGGKVLGAPTTLPDALTT